MNQTVDVAIVGGGILGLAFAWEAARRGKTVALFERDRQAQGASIRNFGMIWPIGQPPGERYTMATRSRERWLELASEGVLWVNPCGSLHAVYEEDEDAVLREFAEVAPRQGIACEYVSAVETLRRFPAINPERLSGSLFSAAELAVDPRQAIAALPKWLATKYGVQCHFQTTIGNVADGTLRTAAGAEWRAQHTIIASGIDFETLFPVVYSTANLRRCKLQMMRTAPQPKSWRLGPHLAGGLTLAHYKSFEVCPSLAAVKKRIAATMPEYVQYGIHVMASQNELGEVILGDSHEYEESMSIFNSERIDELVLQYLGKMLKLPNPTITARWHGVYAKHATKTVVIEEPQPGVTIVAAPGGAGMTLAFGIARNWWETQP